LTIKTMEYIEAARSLGAGQPFIIGSHILPNSIAPSIVQLSLALSWAILTEAALSFLGLGTLPPNPSWGSMLSESRTLMEIAPWMAISPGMAIMFGVLGFNLLGDGLRDVLDPRMHTGFRA
jgi:peptide/nickel transport system permease protein